MLELRYGRMCNSDAAVVGANIGLACVDGSIAVLAFFQLIRMHMRNSHLGWTRQKVFHLIIGSSNIGFFLYFVLNPIAACEEWSCWSHSCGFILMAFPKILLIAAFFLLLSFWVDLCHQAYDDDEDEGFSPQEPLLDKMNKTVSIASSQRRWFTFRCIHVGSRQKVVILVTMLIFVIMIAASALIWIGVGKNPIESTVVAQVYVDFIAVVVILLGGALACYGIILFLRMRQVRSERASSDMQKVAGLASVSVICFTASASIAISTNIPLFYQWHEQKIDSVYTSLVLVFYYLIGWSLPSVSLLFAMRELPPQVAINRNEETTTTAFISHSSVAAHYPQYWTAATSGQNQAEVHISLHHDEEQISPT